MTHGAMQPFALTLDKFLDHAAKWHPDAEVVTAHGAGGSDRIGYAALRTRAQRVSGVLVDLGVARGDRVATLAWNTQAHVEAWYAIMGMGAVCHTLNPRLMASQLAAMLAQSEARVLIASADLAPLVQQILAQAPLVAHVLVIDGAAAGLRQPPRECSISALKPAIAAARDDVVWGDFDETAPSGLCFTSGTTGAPKGVTYTHRSSYLHTLRLLQADVIGLTAHDAVLAVVPMFHANAWGLPFAAPAVGAKLVLPGRHADGARLARLIVDEGVTVAVGVPTVWLGLLEHLEASGDVVPSLQRILVGGAPMPPALMERLERQLGVIVQTSWGMTELSPLGTAAASGDSGRDAALSGRPAVGVDLLLTDGEGRVLPEQRGVEGHLKVRGAAVVERYFGDGESATTDGWFDTGDLARIDACGNVTITGRAKDLIKSGGEWINPAEIEAIVAALPQVALVAVIGRADPKWGERPILVVETRGGDPIADDDLLEALRGRVAPWWIPDAVIRIPNMPLASTGKIDKMRLRSDYGQE
ncbi:AMP-binding protein [Hephaestia sp. GCM10023244]|uniref:AMP-binding protein n=1 Tax=unclassified Hephaestia TaxID=2631281 RepID=UPI0020772C07|nr:AMP-binding protein [Hephaestia sp. MAHUQ-44]MCM8731646.1 AMP-binding protein [Hephaestia sp. MAHUQ-44]